MSKYEDYRLIGYDVTNNQMPLASHLRDVTRYSMCNEQQLSYLFMLAMLAPDGAAVECGVYQGGSLFAWAQARLGRGKVYAIDNYGHPRWERELPIFNKQVKERGLESDVILMRIESWDAPTKLRLSGVEDVAFCFIDATHGIEGFPKDIAVWPQMIKPGGILVLHDYDVKNPNVVVKEYADKWQKQAQWEVWGNFHNTMAYRRPL